MIFADYSGRKPERYIVPADEARVVFKKHHDDHLKEHAGERPHTPDSSHVGLGLGDPSPP
jgi:hypothetical protein